MIPEQSMSITARDIPLGVHSTLPSPVPKRKLLWVDDSSVLLSLYKTVFERLGFEIASFISPKEALASLSGHRPDAAILDYDMPEMSGAALASSIKHRLPKLPIILYTGKDSIPRAAHRSVDAVCFKAAPCQRLIAAIEHLLPRRHPKPGNSPRSSRRLSNV